MIYIQYLQNLKKMRLKLLLGMLFLVAYFSLANMVLQKDPPTTWENQMEFMKNMPPIGNGTDLDSLKLVSHAYKGIIKSEREKDMIIDSMLSDNSFILCHHAPLIEADTVFVSGEFYEIHRRSYPMFEILPICKIVELNGGKDPFIPLKQQLHTNVQIGFGIVELEYTYKGNTFYSIAIVSNDHGGVIYENIGYNIGIREEVERLVPSPL